MQPWGWLNLTGLSTVVYAGGSMPELDATLAVHPGNFTLLDQWFIRVFRGQSLFKNW
jgi:hypothetical protein